MQAANITIVFKKDDRTDKANYRAISMLPDFSKVLERCLYNQLFPFFDKVLSVNQCGFRKSFNVQYCLMRRKEKWKQCLEQSLVFCISLSDFSKAFGCLHMG